MILRVIFIILLIISYKLTPVLEPVGTNYIFSLFIVGAIVYEIYKLQKQLKLDETKKKMLIKLSYLSIICLIFSSIILKMHTDNPSGNIRYLRAVLIMAMIVIGGKIIKKISDASDSNLVKNSILVFFSTTAFIGVLEMCFMFIPLTHGSGEAYSGKIWGYKYWNPINKFGFRDEEPKKAKNTIFFVGDSFTAGWGIKNINDRFSEITSKELNRKGITVNEINLGRFGADTKLEFHLFKNFINKSKISPNHIVLQYFVNDMDNFIPSNSKCISTNKQEQKWKQLSRKGSYLVNYLVSIYPSSNAGLSLPKECDYIEQLEHIYKTESIWKKEMNELDKFKNYCTDKNIHLTIISFPFMEDLALAKKLNIERRLSQYCAKNKITFVNVSTIIDKIPRSNRIASITDSHASVEVHKIVGIELAKKIKI